MKIWWEKTVEYKFICEYCDKSFLMPLDGEAEKAGDTIANISKKFSLIEFKKKFENIKDEKKKFNRKLLDIPNEIKQLNLNTYDFHKLIYGELDNGKLILKEINYWDGILEKKDGKFLYKEKLIKDGIEYEDFKKYVEKFIKLKKSITTTGSGGFSSIYSNVLGIDSKGNINQVISLQEFAEISFNIDLSLKPKISNPSPRRGPRL